METRFDEYVGEGPPGRRWANTAVWLALVAGGVLIFELTANAALGAVVACAKFGWNDLLTARWLRRIDPNRRRGRVCFLVYVSSGLWKVAVAGTGLLFGLALVTAFTRAGPRQAVPNSVLNLSIGAGLCMVFGFGLSAVTMLPALGLAWWRRLKLWLDPAVHRARKENVWPSFYPSGVRQNRIQYPVMTSLIWMHMFVCIGALVSLSGRAPFQRGNTPAPFLVFVAFVFLGPVSFLVFRDYLNKRLFAGTPAECWGTQVPEEDPTDAGWAYDGASHGSATN